MDPDPTAAAGWTALGDVVLWAKLSGEAAQAETELGSFMTLYGASMDDPIAVVGSMPQPEFSEVLANWMPGGSAPTPTQKSKAAMVGRAARILSGLQMTAAEEKKQKERKEQQDFELEKLKL